MDLKGKVALVTGASLGIGRETAIALAKEGASVIINYKTNPTEANEVLSECNKHSKKNILVKADITSEAESKAMFEKIKKEYGKIDVLVNNAGIFDDNDGVTNLEAFENIFQTNLLGQVRMVKHTLPIMKEGKIISVSSIHGRPGHGYPGAAAYSAMKAALDNYTKNLAKEVAPKILVNAVAPGMTMTPLWGTVSKEEEKEYSKRHLINRFIKPEEIANGIVFIAKNDAICGEVLTIDGGMGLKTLD